MTAFSHVLYLALVHFVWQGTLVALLLWMALLAARNRSANVRYGLSCAALAVLLALPAVTGFALYPRQSPASGVELAASPAPPVTPAPPARTANGLVSFQAWALPIWCAGVLFFSVRLMWGSRQVRRMRMRGEPASEPLPALLARIAGRMGLLRRVEILISSLAAGPSVVGIVRPVVLLPASALLGLTPEQLEAVLAHELAHIRRYDYLVNVLQMMVEALLFYHPAVWWVSSRIRRERELCCDDEAVRACGDSFCYARALTALERIRMSTPSLALGGTDGPLAYRIKRLMGIAPDENLPSRLAGVAALCLALACLAVSVNRVRAQVRPDAPGVRVDLGGHAVIHREPVPYPASAQIQSATGTVSVEVHLDSAGTVSDARVLSGPDDLRKPVLQSVLEWHFAPSAAGSTFAVNVDFRPVPGPAGKSASTEEILDRFKQRQETKEFLREVANFERAKGLDPNQDDNRARHAEIMARAMAELRASAQALQIQAQAEQMLNPGAFSFVTIPMHPEPMVLPPPMAQRFEGRILRSIRLTGIGMSSDDFLTQAQVPIREGDTLTASSINATIAAVRKFDEHLGERWTTVEPNGIELTIFVAPALSAESPKTIEGIEFSGVRRIPHDTLRAEIAEKAGDVYDEEAARRDVQTLWNTNRFDDVQVKTEPGTHGGIALRFVVSERRL